MLNRLDVIETDLQQRRQHATAQGWLGEIEGIDLTLGNLSTKWAHAQRLATRPGPVLLDLPASPNPRRT
jgi:hypothetical protein